MNKTIFLDRDGVVNIERGEYTWKIEDFKLTVGLVEFLKIVMQKGYLAIIISNQGGVGKGLYSIEDVEKVHDYLAKELAKEHIMLTDIYYCPHHPNTGKCLCRKPEPLLLEKAIARYDVDVKKSYFIGDRQRDEESGAKVGLKTIIIESNDHLCNYLPQITD